MLVFTGGVGEHAVPVRRQTAERAEWLGLELDPDANSNDEMRISADHSGFQVFIIPSDEQRMIAREVSEVATD